MCSVRQSAGNAAMQGGCTARGRRRRQLVFAQVTEIYGNVPQGIAQARGLPQRAVADAINEAPLSASRAVELRLLDGAKYR